ncbi:MAG: SPFH domain-containing protein [Ruminococcaceae bacterium]|nr:SPFH domain-containing protein [Oscillospiraceae bacterium]
MALFGKNPNEVNYQGGKKHWTDVIKNTGSPDLLIWRQPEEDFNTNSTLIVMPGEQALFIKGGNIEGTFDKGTYKLSTENYPFISRLRNAFSGGISTFNCVVYFVKQSHSMELKWGTTSPIAVRDKMLGIKTDLRARGAYKISIANPSIFLSKLVGSNVAGITQDSLKLYFGEQFQSKIRSALAKHLNELDTEILGIEARIDEFSAELQPRMQEIVSEYGLNCEQFIISALDIDDSELRKKYDEIGMSAYQKKMEMGTEIQMQKAAFDVLGEDWARQKSAEILSKVAENPGAGGVASAGAGLGMGFAAGNVFGTMAQNMFTPLNNQPQQNQVMPQQAAPSGRFNQQAPAETQAPAAPAPAPAAANADDPMAKLQKLKQFFDMGLITEQEYNAKKIEILSNF